MEARERRRRVASVSTALRTLRVELAVLNHRVGGAVTIRDLDLDCLDVIVRQGPISPGALAGRMGVHVATMTGILGRLEAGGWISRGPAEGDRRAVVVRSVPERQHTLFEAFGGMNTRVGALCERYSDAELDVIVDFLDRVAAAGRDAADELG